MAQLTQQQADDLVYLTEEEKVARDVYEHLNGLYPNQPFGLIMGSEQNHMDAISGKVVKYDLMDRITAPLAERGVFTNAALQAEYDHLIEKGEKSLKDALEVGVHIEEMDIADIIKFMAITTRDIARTMNNLLEGSYNHLDSFETALSRV